MHWERLQRGVASFSITLARGRAELYPELPAKVSGFKQEINAAEWTIALAQWAGVYDRAGGGGGGGGED